MSEKIFTCMQEVLNLHKSYFSGAIIWGSVHPIEEIILLLNNIGMHNYRVLTGALKYLTFFSSKRFSYEIFCSS